MCFLLVDRNDMSKCKLKEYLVFLRGTFARGFVLFAEEARFARGFFFLANVTELDFADGGAI